jgi:hypothetical protein
MTFSGQAFLAEQDYQQQRFIRHCKKKAGGE